MDHTAHGASGMVISNYLLLFVPLLPLLGSLVTYVVGKRAQALSGWIATAFAAASFAVVVSLFRQLGNDTFTASFWNWFAVGPLSVNFGFRFDHLAAVMSLVITGVGSLIHLYAIGYMAEDPSRPRFFSYLNLFLFSMLLLVLGDNLLVMFVGWEGVGLCSYLLIGFWFTEMQNAVAGQKAFVVNRIGDAGFILGMFVMILLSSTLDFQSLQAATATWPTYWKEIVAGLLFIGAVGKSAQIPLYIWLPDAMAGPTPVSALIHAATMVTAGIYMIARMEFLFSGAPMVLMIVMIIGTLTAFVAATIALVQYDIKKVLAYSTVSQLGYMFMAMGAGAFSNGLFHVVTHAFFKACLFMAAGSVIMGCHHEQDMRNYGGLWKKMPVTFATYFIATLAIAGFPFLSGFFSKDQILWTVYSNTSLPAHVVLWGSSPLNKVCWAIGLLTAFLTAFYMTRSLMMTFFGKYRGHEHPHESPWVVTVPLILLAIPSLAFGYLYGDALLHYLAVWTRPDMLDHEALHANPTYHSLEVLSIAVALVGMAFSVLCYTVLGGIPRALMSRLPMFYKLLTNKWWVDEIYGALIVRPLRGVSMMLFRVVDRLLIDDAVVNGAGMFVEANGEVARRVQGGQLRFYSAYMFIGVFVLVGFYLLSRVL